MLPMSWDTGPTAEERPRNPFTQKRRLTRAERQARRERRKHAEQIFGPQFSEWARGNLIREYMELSDHRRRRVSELVEAGVPTDRIRRQLSMSSEVLRAVLAEGQDHHDWKPTE